MAMITYSLAKSIRIDQEINLYGLFVYNEYGDLFLSSELGSYHYKWNIDHRGMECFMSKCNSKFILFYFECEYVSVSNRKIHESIKEKLLILIDRFLDEMRAIASGRKDPDSGFVLPKK